jgi:DNA-binding transcriptional regulator YiaG
MERSIRPTSTPPADIAEARLIAPVVGKSLRQAAGISLADVGRYCQVSRQCVWSWESGRTSPRGLAAVRYLSVLRDLEAGFPQDRR